MEFKQFSFCEQGKTHIQQGMPCEDAVLSEQYEIEGEKFYIGVVSDGLGSSSYCRASKGAQFAVKATYEAVKKELEILKQEGGGGRFKDLLEEYKSIFFKNLYDKIFGCWKAFVEKDMEIEPLSIEEKERLKHDDLTCAYACTLIAAIVVDGYWFSIQVGDGNCMEFYAEDVSFKESTSKDPMCVGEVTTHLAMPKVVERHFRSYYSDNVPDAILLHTDGIDDTLMPEMTRFAAYDDMILQVCADCDNGIRYIEQRIKHYAMANEEKMDDTTIAGIMNMERLNCFKNRIKDVISGRKIKRAVINEEKRQNEATINQDNYRKYLERLNLEKGQLIKEYQVKSRYMEGLKKKIEERQRDILFYESLVEKEQKIVDEAAMRIEALKESEAQQRIMRFTETQDDIIASEEVVREVVKEPQTEMQNVNVDSTEEQTLVLEAQREEVEKKDARLTPMPKLHDEDLKTKSVSDDCAHEDNKEAQSTKGSFQNTQEEGDFSSPPDDLDFKCDGEDTEG